MASQAKTKAKAKTAQTSARRTVTILPTLIGAPNLVPAATSPTTTTVVSWGQRDKKSERPDYVFPPGLFGVDAMSYGAIGLMFLNMNGTLTGWNPNMFGGRTPFHKYLETLTDIKRVIPLPTDLPSGSQGRMGVILWSKKGGCSYHSIDWRHEYSESLHQMDLQINELGNDVIDVLCNDEHEICVSIHEDGTVRALDLYGCQSDSDPDEVNRLATLCAEISKSGKLSASKYKCGYLSSNEEMTWLETDGTLRTLAVHWNWPEDTTCEPRMFTAKEITDYASDFAIKDGVVYTCYHGRSDDIHLDPTMQFDRGAYASIDEPVVRLKKEGSRPGHSALAFSASGRAFMVCRIKLSKKEDSIPLLRYNVSPEKYRIHDACHFVMDNEHSFVGLAAVPVTAEAEFKIPMPQVVAKPAPSTIVTAGIGEDLNAAQYSGYKSQMHGAETCGSIIDYLNMPVDPRGVLDAVALYDAPFHSSALIAVKSDGRLVGKFRWRKGLDIHPPWFPHDIVRLSFQEDDSVSKCIELDGWRSGRYLHATRTDGRILTWSSPHFSRSTMILAPERIDLLVKHSSNQFSRLKELKPLKIQLVAGIWGGIDLAMALVPYQSCASAPFDQFVDAYSNGKSQARDRVFYMVTRGHELLSQSVSWTSNGTDKPKIGRPGPSAETRAAQWRLCIGWSGFETWMTGLLPEGEKLDARGLSWFGTDLPEMKILRAPERGKDFDRWVADEGGEAVLHFLGVDGTDRDTLLQWMMNGRDVPDWTGMVLIARALHNATVHGALSASKAFELGILDALERLPSLLMEFANHALHQYMKKTIS
ncbi:MAG: hypothetical protein FJ280_08305 [Planctomycetes bacterium]|nr:hypothetical protein [Planctomycetota bacterium]